MAELTPEILEAMAAARERSTDALAAELALLNEESEVFQTIGQKIDTNNKLLKIEGEMAQQQIKLLEEQLKKKIAVGEADEVALKSIGEQIAEQKKIIDGTNKRIKASETLQATTAGIVTSLTGIDDSWKQTFVGSFMESLTTATSLNQVVGDLGAGLTSAITPANVLGASISKVTEASIAMAVAQDEAIAAFNKATSTGGKYDGMITDIAQTNRAFGISAEDSASSIAQLYSGLNLFSSLTPKAQKEMATLVSRLDAIGVSSETSVANIELAMRALGMSADEAQNLQLELVATADALAVPPQTIAEGFARAAPQLAAHGRQMIDVFKDMAVQSKQTGLAMDELLGFASQFNTYEGAAQITADFNHLLGGAFLNSLELLNATEAERIELIQDAMKSSGQSFDQMDAHTKRAIAHHLGLRDVAEASRLLNPEMVGLTKAQREARIEEEELAKRAQLAQSVLTELKNAALSLAVGLQPVVKGISSVVNFLVQLNDKTTFTIGGFKLSLIPAIILAAGALRTLGLVIRLAAVAQGVWTAATAGATIAQGAWNLVKQVGTFLMGADSAAQATNTAAKATNTVATQAQTTAQTASNTAAKGGIKTMLAFAGAVALMGVGIGAAAAGIGSMAEGFSMLNPGQMNAVLIVLGGLAAIILVMGLLMLSPVGAGATLGILALGAAILMMGAGVAIAALGITALVTSMQGLNPETILAAGAAFTAMGAALLPLMPWVLTGPLLAAVLMAIGVAALMIGGGFALAADSIATFDNLLSNISTESVANLEMIADQIERIVDSINDLSVIKAGLFENIVSKIVPQGAQIEAGGTAAAVTAAAVQRAQSGVQTAAQTTPKGAQQQQPQIVPVQIILDGRVLGEIVDKRADKRIGEALKDVGGRRNLTPLKSSVALN